MSPCYARASRSEGNDSQLREGVPLCLNVTIAGSGTVACFKLLVTLQRSPSSTRRPCLQQIARLLLLRVYRLPAHQALTGPPGGMLCQVTLGPVPLLRFRADPKQGDPDERYFQYVQGLMNITSPKAAGGWEGSDLSTVALPLG